MTQTRGLLSKYAIKEVDRLLSNQGIVIWDIFGPWIAQMVGQRTAIVVAMDWTDFDADDQTTLALNRVTSHGRATPLLWLSVTKDELKVQRNDLEDLCLARLAEALPEGVAVTILADRGFGDTKLFGFLDRLGFAYVIRFRGNIHVTAADGETRPATAWVDVGVTAGRHRVGAVVCVKAKAMKEAWCLVASDAATTTRENGQPLRQVLDDRTKLSRHQGLAVRHGARGAAHRRSATPRQAASAERFRDRAADAARRCRRKPRHGPSSQEQYFQAATHSLFNQGCMLHAMIPTMPEQRLRPLIEQFSEFINQNKALAKTFSVVLKMRGWLRDYTADLICVDGCRFCFNMNRIAGIQGGSMHIIFSNLAGIPYRNCSGSLYAFDRAFAITSGTCLNEFSYEQVLLDGRLDLRIGRTPTGTDFDSLPTYFEFITGLCALPAGFTFDKGAALYLTASTAGIAKLDLGKIGYQTTFKDNLFPKSYNIGGFFDSGAYSDPYANAAGQNWLFYGGPPKFDHGRSGISLQAEQVVYRPDPDNRRALPLFASANFTTSGNANITNAYFGGFSNKGPFASWPNDSLNAVGEVINLNNAYLSAIDTNLALQGIAGRVSGSESCVEVNSGIAIAFCISSKPSYTYIWSPDQVGGEGRPLLRASASHKSDL